MTRFPNYPITHIQLCPLSRDGEDFVEIPSARIEGPVDPVGAGDTVVAAMASAPGAGVSPPESGMFAKVAAAVTARELRQASTATLQEILKLSSRQPPVHILARSE